jgi:hypothetical protein
MKKGEKTITTVKIQIGRRIFNAKLLDNASSQALMVMMPITITMTELNKNEKYYNMPNKLPANPQRVANINNGDLMLYGSDCLVLFYKSFTTSYSYTRLGYLEDVSELASTLGNGNVEITLSLAR